MSTIGSVKVWDPLVRIGHWLLAAAVIAAWLTRHSPGRWHEWIGYGSLALVALRVLWGFIGPEHARFARFVRSPAHTLRYARDVLLAREPRYLGHNPLGAWMILALLIVVTLVGATGWLYTTERFWGIEWVERLHATLTDVLLVLAGLHVAGAVFSSFRHREDLVGAMIHGRKRP